MSPNLPPPLPDRLAAILRDVLTDPAAAAARVESLATELSALARRLRAAAPARKDAGGMNDRVVLKVTGADGAVKQVTDTH